MWTELTDVLLHLFYPMLCPACDEEETDTSGMLCFGCQHSLPFTGFEDIRNNAVEKLFWGRVDICAAFATMFYHEKSSIQRIVHEIKYKNNPELAMHMGKLMGIRMDNVIKTYCIDVCIPMPLHPKKLKKRGYNQAALLCKGIETTGMIPMIEQVLVRRKHTATQTKKSRIERWDNVGDVFSVEQPESILGKHILLVDDVITTGASTEACAQTLFQAGAGMVSIAGLAFTP